MRPVAPRMVGVDEEHAGIDNQECKSLTVGVTLSPDKRVVIITRWRLTDEERARVFGGEDIFLFIFSEQMPEMQIHVGSPFHQLEP